MSNPIIFRFHRPHDYKLTVVRSTNHDLSKATFARHWVSLGMLAIASITSLTTSTMALGGDALPTDGEAEKLGLVIRWRAQSERTPIGTGKTGIALWPSSDKQETITVRVGNREVEKIDANQVDTVEVEKLIFAETKVKKLPRLGMEAARAKANQIVKRYEVLGRKATLEEHSQPITYLIAASRDGAVQGFDAESGQILWGTSVGSDKLPTYGPGVNDEYVAVANGNIIYVLDLKTGKLVGQKHLNEAVAAAPQPINNKIYCSTLGGSIFALDADQIGTSEMTSARFSGGIVSPVTPSVNRLFIAWPNKKYIYFAQTGRSFQLWNRLESSDIFVAAPQPTDDGFISVSSGGMVYRTNLNRQESIIWRHNLATQVEATPLLADGLILVATDSGALAAIKVEDGEQIWFAEEPDVAQALAVTPTKIYAQLYAGQLVAIDRKTGKTLARIERSFAIGVRNTVNDRIVLSTESGSIICLHEPEATYPRLNRTTVTSDSNKVAKKETKPSSSDSESDSTEPAAKDVNDPFGENSMAPAATRESNDTADPFGGSSTESPTKEDDPFAGS